MPIHLNLKDLKYHANKIRDGLGHVHEKTRGLI